MSGNPLVEVAAGEERLGKELVETCCKSILTKREIAFTKSDDLGDLAKKVTKALQLVPEGISEATNGRKTSK